MTKDITIKILKNYLNDPTTHNRSVSATPPFRRLGLHSARSWFLRNQSHASLHHILGACKNKGVWNWLPLFLLVSAPKTSPTSETLGEMAIDIILWKCYNINKGGGILKIHKILFFIILLFISTISIYANSSWNWFTKNPITILPWIILSTILIEITFICMLNKINKLKNIIITSIVIIIANLISFILPYIFLGFIEDVYEGMGLGFFELINIWLDKSPVYIISIGYLIITLVLEMPFIYIIISKIASDRKKLLYSVFLANVITTILTTIIERILYRGSWWYIKIATSPNRTVNVRRLKAARLRKIAVGLRPLCNFLSAKVFCARKMLRIFLIGHKKPSFTAGTLCASFSKLVGKQLKTYLQNIGFILYLQ